MLVHTVMTSWMKLSVRNMSSQLRRIRCSAAKSAIRVPCVIGVAKFVVAGAKLIALGALNRAWPEKIGVGTRSSTMGNRSKSVPFKEELRREVMGGQVSVET